MIRLLGVLLCAVYLMGVIVTLVLMITVGHTPKHWGLARPYTAEEYFFEPLAWPIVWAWYFISKY